MAQPQRDHRWINPMGTQPHRGRMSKHMRTYRLLFQGGTGLLGALCVTGDEFFDRVATEWPTANARKHALTLCRQILSQPGLQHRGRVVAERRAPLFPSLPLAPDVCATPQDDILAPETDQFRDAQTRLDRDSRRSYVGSPAAVGVGVR